ncbi:MAG: hypothetical protein AAGH15_07695, partial [Myxococcota bacterium]
DRAQRELGATLRWPLGARRRARLVGLALPLVLPAVASAGDLPEGWEAALARYAHEPSLEVLLAAAADPALDPAVALRNARRDRRAGWLPTLRFQASRGQTIDLADQGGERARVSRDDDLQLEATLTFRFDRVVYGSDEVAWAREARTRTRELEARRRAIAAAYLERRRLQIERDLEGLDDVERRFRLRELEALLDVLTGGAFSELLGPPPAARPEEPPPAED